MDIRDQKLFKQIKKINDKLFIMQMVNDSFCLPREDPDGFIEYKRTLVDCDDAKCEKYATQMQWRIMQNLKNNIAYYYIGVDDDGSIIGLTDDAILESVKTILKIVGIIEGSIQSVNIIYVGENRIMRIVVKKKKLRDSYHVNF